MRLGEMSLEEAAKEAAGNWRDFDCLCWHRASELKDAENWAIVYTHNRDSGLTDQSNASTIEEALTPFTKGTDPNVVFETHNHWAVGHVDGASIRVFRRSKITKAFRTYHGLAVRLANYPLLDEDDYYAREYEETLANFGDAAWKLKKEYELPKGWERAVFHWLAEYDCDAIENTDDRGGYPSEEQLRAAFEALDYRQTAMA